MARKKTSGAGGAIGAALFGMFVLIAAVPKQVWIAAGVIAILALVVYLYRKSNSSTSTQVEPSSMRPPERTEVQAQGTAWSKRRGPRPDTTPTPAPLPNAAPINAPVADAIQLRATPPTSTLAPAPVASFAPARPPAKAPEYRVPPPPASFGAGRWIAPGQDVEVANVKIPGGLVYVGTSLKAPSGATDPCLIDPSLPVSKTGDYRERLFGYWPSYSDIPPAARRAYLNWLGGGRQAPDAEIGFVFLFFYGLERRAVLDASADPAARADWPVIAQELRRLLGIYGDKSGSFRRYAGELLDWVSLADHPAKLYEQPVPEFPRLNEVPLYVRLALGQAAIDAAPVPAHLALAWAKLDPIIYLRTPAQRCPEQFEALFAMRYADAFGAGLALPKNRTKLKFVYRPASSGFQGTREVALHFGDTPDVTVLTAPLKKLSGFVEAVQRELEPYSRFVGRQPEAKDSLEALLQLPAPLWTASAQAALEAIKTRRGDGMVALKFQELLAKLGATTAFAKDKTVALAKALESANVGMEPDVLDGAKTPKPDETVVLFASQVSEPTPRSTPAYRAALLTLQLSSAVSAADGEFSATEMSHLRAQVLSWTHLTPNHVRRLLAQLRLLMTAPVPLTALKKKLEPLDPAAKDVIARFMATLAQADGTVSPAEIKMLEKAYAALGIDPKRVFTDVHASAAQVPSSPESKAKVATSGFMLDSAKIAALQQETNSVSALLASIFVDEAETPVETPEVEAETAPSPGASMMGLDEAHTAFARMLLSRPSWTSAELGGIAADLELMLDGALERINDASFDAYGLPLIEGDDPVEVNTEVLEKLEA